jgi:hypothetical protein
LTRRVARVADAGNRASQKPGVRSPEARRAKPALNDARPKYPRRLCQARLDRILVGEDVITNGVLPEATLEEHAQHSKYVVYLELSVTTEGADRGQRVSHQDFRLEDTEGLIYTPIQSSNPLLAEPDVGGAACIGVAFAVYNDSAPARLLYRTGEETFLPLPESIFWGTRD